MPGQIEIAIIDAHTAHAAKEILLPILRDLADVAIAARVLFLSLGVLGPAGAEIRSLRPGKKQQPSLRLQERKRVASFSTLVVSQGASDLLGC